MLPANTANTDTNAIATYTTDTHNEVTDAIVASVTTAAVFLPSLRLYTSRSEKVATGKVTANMYCKTSASSDMELGTSIDVVPMRWATKGMDISSPTPISVYPKEFDKETGAFTDPEFLRIRDAADVPGAQDAMYGYEVLCWVPQLSEFLLFFCCSFSSKVLFKDFIYRNIGKPMTLSSVFKKGPKYSYQVPTAVLTSSIVKMPTQEQVETAYKIWEDTISGNPRTQAAPVVEGGRVR